MYTIKLKNHPDGLSEAKINDFVFSVDYSMVYCYSDNLRQEILAVFPANTLISIIKDDAELILKQNP